MVHLLLGCKKSVLRGVKNSHNNYFNGILFIYINNNNNKNKSKNEAGFFSFFAKNARKNLHIILVMDCSSPEFVIRCESNPALYKECAILWNHDLSSDTYITLPKSIMNATKDNETAESKKIQRQITVNDKLSLSFYEMHKTIDSSSATPAKFINFVSSYENVYEGKKDKILERKDKLSKGVSKLKEAREIVAKLKKEAAVQEKILAEKQGLIMKFSPT